MVSQNIAVLPVLKKKYQDIGHVVSLLQVIFMANYSEL